MSLCDIAITPSSTLADLLLLACESKVANLTEEMIEQNIICGSRLLLILDGWDEASNQICKRSFVANILQSLPLRSKILITSRSDSPAAVVLQDLANHVKFIGFAEESTHKYYQKALIELIDAMKEKFQNPKSFRRIYGFEFDKTGLKQHLPNHGITVIIPENAVDGKAILRIGVYYIDSFQFLEDHRLVSDVFWIDSSIPLHETATVQLYMPHCVMKSDSKNLKFFLAPDESFKRSGVLKFIEANKHAYSFEPDNYGKIMMNHFCSGCILEKKENGGLPLEYYFGHSGNSNQS